MIRFPIFAIRWNGLPYIFVKFKGQKTFKDLLTFWCWIPSSARHCSSYSRLFLQKKLFLLSSVPPHFLHVLWLSSLGGHEHNSKLKGVATMRASPGISPIYWYICITSFLISNKIADKKTFLLKSLIPKGPNFRSLKEQGQKLKPSGVALIWGIFGFDFGKFSECKRPESISKKKKSLKVSLGTKRGLFSWSSTWSHSHSLAFLVMYSE